MIKSLNFALAPDGKMVIATVQMEPGAGVEFKKLTYDDALYHADKLIRLAMQISENRK